MLVKVILALCAALIAAPIIAIPMIVESRTWPEAKAIIEEHGGYKMYVTGFKLPCAGGFNFGFVVSYRHGRDDRVGRICRGIFGDEWTWYPSTDTMIAEKHH